MAQAQLLDPDHDVELTCAEQDLLNYSNQLRPQPEFP